MKRMNYSKIITDNAREHFCSVIPLEEGIKDRLILWVKKNDTPSGNDRIKSFFVIIGLYGYHLDFVKTISGDFLKIKKQFMGV